VAKTDEVLSPHDILQAWQAGEFGYREAMRLTASESLFELYQACRSSGVDIRKDLTAAELRAAEAAVADILALDEAEDDPDISRGLGL
jgi:hypothetical protein